MWDRFIHGALAEQGARVTGIDLDEDALIVARDRCEAHGVFADIRFANVVDFDLDDSYGLVIFYACLEQ